MVLSIFPQALHPRRVVAGPWCGPDSAKPTPEAPIGGLAAGITSRTMRAKEGGIYLASVCRELPSGRR